MMHAYEILTRLPISMRWVAHLNILQFLVVFRIAVLKPLDNFSYFGKLRS